MPHRSPADDQTAAARRRGVVLLVVAMIVAALPLHLQAGSLTSVSWKHEPAGRTAIVLGLSPGFAHENLRHYSLMDPPRAVVVLTDTRTDIDARELIVGNRLVSGVRLVHQPDRTPPELLVVLDLAVDAARIVELRRDGDWITVVVGDEGPSTPTPSAATATPTIVATSTATSSPTDTPTAPADTSTPSATPTIAATTTTTPSPTEPGRDIARSSTDPEEDTTTVLGADVLATPTPDPDPVVASRVVEVAASPRGDGSTLLRITADGRLTSGSARTLEVADDPPRVIVTLRGLSAPELPRTLELDNPLVDRVRLIHDPEIGDGELHLVLQLTGSGATVGEMQQIGPHLVVQLVPRSIEAPQ